VVLFSSYVGSIYSTTTASTLTNQLVVEILAVKQLF